MNIEIENLKEVRARPDTHALILDMQRHPIAADPDEDRETLIVKMPYVFGAADLAIFEDQDCCLALDGVTGWMAVEMVSMLVAVEPYSLTLWNTANDDCCDVIKDRVLNHEIQMIDNRGVTH